MGQVWLTAGDIASGRCGTTIKAAAFFRAIFAILQIVAFYDSQKAGPTSLELSRHYDFACDIANKGRKKRNNPRQLWPYSGACFAIMHVVRLVFMYSGRGQKRSVDFVRFVSIAGAIFYGVFFDLFRWHFSPWKLFCIVKV